MKRTAMNHTKMKRLIRVLKIPQYAVVGILESIWHLAAREAPEGDIGKLSNEDIAAWIDWDGNGDDLIAALVDCKWIDEDEEHRLVIHDWSEHCDDGTKKAISRKKEKDSKQVQTSPDISGQGEDADGQNTPAVAVAVAVPCQAEPEPGEKRTPMIIKPTLPMPASVLRPINRDSELVATAVMTEFGISDRFTRTTISDVAQIEFSKLEGITPEVVSASMIAARRDYEKNAGKMKWPLDIEKFYGKGLWKNSPDWPWREDQRPAALRPKAVEVAYDTSFEDMVEQTKQESRVNA